VVRQRCSIAWYTSQPTSCCCRCFLLLPCMCTYSCSCVAHHLSGTLDP
jgi:hypothetical protein